MSDYILGAVLYEQGWTDTTELRACEAEKLTYVTDKLAPAVTATREWRRCIYRVVVKEGWRREYVVLYSEVGDGLWINVTGNSLGAIFEAVGKHLYR